MSVIETIRAAFEYQGQLAIIEDAPLCWLQLTYMTSPGQKCSALSRLYVPKSLWTAKGGFKEMLVEECNKITVGSVHEFEHFMTPVM
jgi:acyl-CoA reductase-like NAD-dependent aldehyde dehydrogenase